MHNQGSFLILDSVITSGGLQDPVWGVGDGTWVVHMQSKCLTCCAICFLIIIIGTKEWINKYSTVVFMGHSMADNFIISLSLFVPPFSFKNCGLWYYFLKGFVFKKCVHSFFSLKLETVFMFIVTHKGIEKKMFTLHFFCGGGTTLAVVRTYSRLGTQGLLLGGVREAMDGWGQTWVSCFERKCPEHSILSNLHTVLFFPLSP